MKALKISEQNGLYTLETSDGRRTSSASFEGVILKLSSLSSERGFDNHLRDVWASIKSTGGGQIASGQASG